MRILVTGASGFIGRALCVKLLELGHDVIGLCRTSREFKGSQLGSFRYISYKMGDLLPEDVKNFSPEVLVHLAWDGIPDFSNARCFVNVQDQLRFFDHTAELAHLKKVIGAGTCLEYGAYQGACVESDRIEPDSYFSWAKQTLADYFRLVCLQRQMNFVWFRIFYIYGPGQRAESLIPTLIQSFKSKKDPQLKNPYASNDFIYIDDVIRAFVIAIEDTKLNGTFNLGSSTLTSVEEVAKIVAQAVGIQYDFTDQIRAIPYPSVSKASMWADITQPARKLGWTPQIALFDGIKLTCGSKPT
jgi:nucleoside-diphosphate-sugar epimerase